MTSRLVKLGEVAEINPRSGAKEFLEPESSVSFVSMSDISDVTFRIENETEKSFESTAKGYTAFERCDVLLAKITPCFENGKLAVADIQHPFGFGSTEFHVIRPRENRIDARFVYHVLRQEKIRIDGERKMTGSAGQRRVPKHFLEDLEILLPSLEVQKRIASILDAADALRAKRHESLRKLEVLLKSVFLEMFGDPVTNPKGWEVRPLESYLTFLTSGSRGWAQYYSTSGTVFLRIQNVGKNELFLDDLAFVDAPESAEKKRTTVQPGDVLVSITADLGRTAAIPDGFPIANISQHLGLLRTTGIVPEYLSAFLSSPGGQTQFQRLNRGGVKAGLNFDDLKSLLIPNPPSDLQLAHKSRETQIRQAIIKLESSLASLETLFSSLQDQAFNGTLESPSLAQLEVQTSLF